MKIENQELLEQMYSKILAVFRDPNSTLEQVFEAYKAEPEKQPENTPFIEYNNGKQFHRHVIKAAFRERIAILLGQSKTFDEAFAIYKGIPKRVTIGVAVTKDHAAEKALRLANCRQALDVCRYAPSGIIGERALAKASSLAKTPAELWQVAVHSYARGIRSRKFWVRAVKKLATKIK